MSHGHRCDTLGRVRGRPFRECSRRRAPCGWRTCVLSKRLVHVRSRRDSAVATMLAAADVSASARYSHAACAARCSTPACLTCAGPDPTPWERSSKSGASKALRRFGTPSEATISHMYNGELRKRPRFCRRFRRSLRRARKPYVGRGSHAYLRSSDVRGRHSFDARSAHKCTRRLIRELRWTRPRARSSPRSPPPPPPCRSPVPTPPSCGCRACPCRGSPPRSRDG